jgi:hypothetical protein
MKPAVMALGIMNRWNKRIFARIIVANSKAIDTAPASITIFHEKSIAPSLWHFLMHALRVYAEACGLATRTV